MPVLYDHLEERSGVAAALRAAGVTPRAGPFLVGDYVISDRLIVERKTGSDLAASIKDRRLFEQVERLTEAYASVVLLVEGEPVHISRASWEGAVARVLVAGVSVLRTAEARESAAWLARLCRQEEKGPSQARGRPRVRRPTDDDEQTAHDVLSCLPGISFVTARRLLDHFGTLAAVFAADEARLREVPGIGP